MVSLQSAEQALKTVYLGVIAEQLNTGINPLMAKIQHTSNDVWGKDIVKLVTYGINGGIGAGTETGKLPAASGNNYARFRLELKNLYGTIEISDKAIRASGNSSGAFVSLLNAEMDGLLKASKYNIGRMLYGDGSGKLTTLDAAATSNVLSVQSTVNLMEGMLIDIYQADTGMPYSGLSARKIATIDRENNEITLAGQNTQALKAGDYITVQGSSGNELTGLGAIFRDDDLYGLDRNEHTWLRANVHNVLGSWSLEKMQTILDEIEQVSGTMPDFISCSYKIRRFYIQEASAFRINVDCMHLDGGYQAISYNGIPIVADKFVEGGDLYMLNTKDFKMHELCDWRWLEGDSGNILKQKTGEAAYTATLVKYADLVCDRPIGQAKLSDLTL